MLYCPKCKSLCEDSAVRCPECGKRKLREPTQLDKVLLVTVTEMEAQRLEPVMKESGIPFEMHPSNIDGIPSIYNSDAILSNQSFYVLLPQLEEAEKVVSDFRRKEAEAAKAAKAAKADAQDASEEEEMSRGKRMLVQIVSVLAFILLIWLVVMGTDWIANNLWSWVQNQGL